ncbi:hypothetical protein WA026_011920 [Henosepilachna vigintioctopunctata]|uniref:Uncharacterized protein n=1 Tax=Henosepilachna vigintioctopunctata TaxID=420089 RepID=A0AAW1UCC2_9CUCU
MDFKVYVLDQIKENYKPILIFLSGTAICLIASKYFKIKTCDCADGKKTITKEIPSVEDIQRFIEELPLDASQLENSQEGLKELLSELSEISDDEEWKELVASLQKFYDESTVM